MCKALPMGGKIVGIPRKEGEWYIKFGLEKPKGEFGEVREIIKFGANKERNMESSSSVERGGIIFIYHDILSDPNNMPFLYKKELRVA